MRSSISTYKESLSRIVNEVFDDGDDLAIPSPSHAASSPSLPDPRRYSRRQSRVSSSPSSSASPLARGIDSGTEDEVARYKADILKLQASEAEIKALSYNYAAMLKEKEEELAKLREENGSLKKNLETSAGNGSRDEGRKLSSSPKVMKSTADQSPPSRWQRSISQENSHTTQKSNSSKADGYSNGRMQEYPNFEDNGAHLAAVQTKFETEIKELKSHLQIEREQIRTLKQKLQDEHQKNDAYQREVRDITNDKHKISTEMEELLKDLDKKTLEIVQLQAELRTQEAVEKSGQNLGTLKDTIRTLEKENARLKVERDDISEKLRVCSTSTSEDLQKVTEEMARSIKKLEEMLKEACKERDKAKQELARLKQHLLDKELEDSDKMDEDNKLIEQLRITCDHQRAQMSQLEKALKQEMTKREEIRKLNDEELRASSETIHNLQLKLKNCMAIVDSKNDELLNLQSALGQYYAEVEAKERLGRELAMAREESSKLAESLKALNKELELAKKEKEDISSKVMHAERMLLEGKHSIQKFEEENSKLRRALEQNMTRLNRMSLDSDNYVDRRIVIKLLVTYFQRNHSKEVLDLMVRMLGFSEEDKQRIGFAHQTAGKGVVRGVLGLPGRLVGGILGGNSPGTSSHFDSDNQSFADLWVDFLLKEGEERERRESSEVAKVSSSAEENNTTTAMVPKLSNDSVQSQVSSNSRVPTVNISADQRSASLPSKKYGHFEHSDTEFSTVPLTSDNSSDRSYNHRLPPRY